MISRHDMLGIIATEAIDPPLDRPVRQMRVRQPARKSPSCRYNLRVVRMPDGRLEWRD